MDTKPTFLVGHGSRIVMSKPMPAAPRPKKMQKLLNKIIGIPVNMIKVPLTKDEKRIRRIIQTQINILSR